MPLCSTPAPSLGTAAPLKVVQRLRQHRLLERRRGRHYAPPPVYERATQDSLRGWRRDQPYAMDALSLGMLCRKALGGGEELCGDPIVYPFAFVGESYGAAGFILREQLRLGRVRRHSDWRLAVLGEGKIRGRVSDSRAVGRARPSGRQGGFRQRQRGRQHACRSLTLWKPMSRARSRKQRRHTMRPYLRITPARGGHGGGKCGAVRIRSRVRGVAGGADAPRWEVQMRLGKQRRVARRRGALPAGKRANRDVF